MRWQIAVAALSAACVGRAPAQAPPPPPFAVEVAVAGSGRVVSTPPGIDCPGACTAAFASDTAVLLTASAPLHLSFAGWDGACAGKAPCTLSGSASVRAAFVRDRGPSLSLEAVSAQEPRLRLDAAPLHLFVRQWVKLTAFRGSAPEPGVAWSVREPDCGSVSDGTFTAPAHAATCHVVASSLSRPDDYGELEIQAVISPAFYDYGGRVLPAPRVRLVWRGALAEFGTAPQLFARFLDGVNGSLWLATLNQYLRGGRAEVVRAADVIAPARAFDPVDPATEVCRALSAAGAAPSAEEIVALLLPAGAGAFDFHSVATCAGVEVPTVIVSMPPAGATLDGACNGSVSASEQMLSAFSHELAEAITDPRPVTAWGDIFGQELADDCVRPVCAQLPTGTFTLSSIWSNAAGGCAR